MVQVLLVGGRDAGPTSRSTDHREHRVEQRHPEDEQRDHQRGEEEPGLPGERIVGLSADRHRGCGEQQAEHERPRVTHEDAGGVEVERQEPEADAGGDDGEHGTHVGRVDHADLEQPPPVEEERSGADRDDARCESVEPVDQVHGVGHPEHPEHRDERRHVRRQHGEAEERDAQVDDRQADQGEQGAAQHHPGQLGGGRDVAQVVDEADEPHDDCRGDHPEQVPGHLEDRCEAVELGGHPQPGEESDEQCRAAEQRCRGGVDGPIAGMRQCAGASRQHPQRRHRSGRRRRGDGHHHEVGVHCGHATRSIEVRLEAQLRTPSCRQGRSGRFCPVHATVVCGRQGLGRVLGQLGGRVGG